MTEKTISTVYTECSIRELPAPIRALIGAAKDMVKKSYAPYSHFHVGAALELSDGTVLTGNNQENASYPCGTCAERSVLNYAKSNYPNLPVTKLTTMDIIQAIRYLHADYADKHCSKPNNGKSNP